MTTSLTSFATPGGICHGMNGRLDARGSQLRSRELGPHAPIACREKHQPTPRWTRSLPSIGVGHFPRVFGTGSAPRSRQRKFAPGTPREVYAATDLAHARRRLVVFFQHAARTPIIGDAPSESTTTHSTGCNSSRRMTPNTQTSAPQPEQHSACPSRSRTRAGPAPRSCLERAWNSRHQPDTADNTG